MNAVAGLALVQLRAANGRVARADVGVNRPAAAARRLLLGKTPAEALKLVPLLFAVCGAAQSAAAAAACEQAMGLPADPLRQSVRALLTTVETLSAHGRFFALDWPQATGETPRIEDFGRLRKALAPLSVLLDPSRGAFIPGGDRPHSDAAALKAAADAAADALQPLIAVKAPTNPPNGPVPPTLRGRGADWFAARLAADAAFAEQPDIDGVPALNLPGGASLPALTVDALLLSRAAAAAQAAETLTAGLIDANPAPDAPTPSAPTPGALKPGEGCGVAQAARGLLAHWVRLEQGRVADWRAVAPTEWNFHPAGPLAQTLTGAPVDPDLKTATERLVCALDPCVPWRVVVIDQGETRDHA